MSYQKPITPQQHFDESVYQPLEPKKKTEKKRPFGRKNQRKSVLARPGSNLSLVTIKSAGSKKSGGAAGSKKTVGSKKGPSSVKSTRRITARKRRA